MTYFTQDYLDFFKELAANNNKDWFHANKKRYEASVKNPFELFVADVVKKTAAIDKRFDVDPKKAIFRIYRDVRFAKDKTPYKTSMSAAIVPGGRKDAMGVPGLYFELGPEHFRFYSGLYSPEKDVLQNVRQYIVKHSDELNRLLADKTFVENFGELRGEKNKVIPKEFKAAAQEQPLIYNKQFYFFAELPPKAIINNDLGDKLLELFTACEPMRKYLTSARGV